MATKQTWQSNILMVPMGGGPSIAPTFQHLHDVSNSVSFKTPQGISQGNRVVEIKGERFEQRGESPLNSLMDGIAVFVGY